MNNSTNIYKGIFISAIGIFILLVNFDILDINFQSDFFRKNFWIFLAGTLLLFRRKSFATGIAFLAIGGLFYLSSVGAIPYTDWSNIWPLFLIAAGFNLLIRHNRRHLA